MIDVAFQHAHTLGRIQQVQRFRSSIPFRAGQLPPTFRPRYLSVYAATCLLPNTLQHSRQGLWLEATLAGFPPACQQIISSTLVHAIVRQFQSQSPVTDEPAVKEHEKENNNNIIVDAATNDRRPRLNATASIPIAIDAKNAQCTTANCQCKNPRPRGCANPAPQTSIVIGITIRGASQRSWRLFSCPASEVVLCA